MRHFIWVFTVCHCTRLGVSILQRVKGQGAFSHAFLLFPDLDMAIAYWNIVLSGRFKFLSLWSQFLQVSIFVSVDFDTSGCWGNIQ